MIKKIPRATMMIPARVSSNSLFDWSTPPMLVAVSPRRTNIVLNERQKYKAGRTTFFVELPRSDNETPETVERYPGTSGKTQGEIKEIKPTKKAVKTVMSTA